MATHSPQSRVVASCVNEIVGRLCERGHRLTPQRYAVVRALGAGWRASPRYALPRAARSRPRWTHSRPPAGSPRHCCFVRGHCRVTFTAQTTGAKSGASLPNSAESSNVEEPERCSDALACESYAGAQAIITAKNFICARTVPRILGNGRRGFKTFLLSITASCCLCRRQGGPTIFASGTRLKIDRVG